MADFCERTEVEKAARGARRATRKAEVDALYKNDMMLDQMGLRLRFNRMGLKCLVKFGYLSSLGVVEMEWAVQRGPRETVLLSHWVC